MVRCAGEAVHHGAGFQPLLLEPCPACSPDVHHLPERQASTARDREHPCARLSDGFVLEEPGGDRSSRVRMAAPYAAISGIHTSSGSP